MNSEKGALDRIDHITLQVADIEASLRWYQSSFRCELLTQDKFRAILRFANVELTLILPSQEPNHLAFFRHDAHTLGTLRARPDGRHSTFIADPTGNPIEIVGVPPSEQLAPEQQDD